MPQYSSISSPTSSSSLSSSSSNNNNNNNIVRYIHILEIPKQYSMGIFLFPPHAKMPLHDHPDMCVMSRLLYGDLKCLSIDLIKQTQNNNDNINKIEAKATTSSTEEYKDDDDKSSNNNNKRKWTYSSFFRGFARSVTSGGMINGSGTISSNNNGNAKNCTSFVADSNIKTTSTSASTTATNSKKKNNMKDDFSVRPKNLPLGSKRAIKNKIKHLRAPSVAILYPYEGNLHEFSAGPNGAAVLDILIPPYDNHYDRDCTFYDIYNGDNDNGAIIDRDDDSISDDDNQEEENSKRYNKFNNKYKQGKAAQQSNKNISRPRRSSSFLNEKTCWIYPTNQPEDFHCLSGTYGDLG